MVERKERIAIVTGASRKIGIGAAIARALARAGSAVFITHYRAYDAGMPWGSRAEDAEDLLAELRQTGMRAAGLELDLSQPDTAPRLFDEVERSLGCADVLVNNATHSESGGVEELTATSIDRHYAVNMRGMMLLCAEFARRRQGRQGGRIINLTSGQSLGPMPGELAYIATKGAVEAFTLSLSAALAPRSITVNAVDPGATETGWMSPALQRELLTHAAAGRLGTPEDAARLVCFLASDDAAWITGQVIHSNGGNR